MSEVNPLVPMPMPNSGTLMKNPWTFVNFSMESRLFVHDLPFKEGREFWAAPCGFDSKPGMDRDYWQAIWRQMDAVPVSSMEQAKMAKLLHKWPHMLLIRVVKVHRNYTFIWWCDAFPRIAHKATASADQFFEPGSEHRWRTTPRRWV